MYTHSKSDRTATSLRTSSWDSVSNTLDGEDTALDEETSNGVPAPLGTVAMVCEQRLTSTKKRAGPRSDKTKNK